MIHIHTNIAVGMDALLVSCTDRISVWPVAGGAFRGASSEQTIIKKRMWRQSIHGVQSVSRILKPYTYIYIELSINEYVRGTIDLWIGLQHFLEALLNHTVKFKKAINIPPYIQFQ